jgi:hypothetical protein
VEITAGGKKMADLVARRNGFENLGEIDGLGNIYRFDLRGRERQNVHRYSPYAAKTVRLSSEPSVGFVEQQTVQPRTAKSYRVPTDPLFSDQWQLANVCLTVATSNCKEIENNFRYLPLLYILCR